jgi:hypothetical protein
MRWSINVSRNTIISCEYAVNDAMEPVLTQPFQLFSRRIYKVARNVA